ncbi:MAG: maleylpyruvate isomerase family mycothiol-dependent enzyme [Candidatus Velamenicoccus archaeovorus]
MDRKQLLGIARAERARLGRTIQYAPPAAWEAPSPCEGWRNRDVVAHLVAQEYAAAQVVAGEDAEEFAAFRAANEGAFWVNGFNEWAVGIRGEQPTRQVITDWGRAADLLLMRLGELSDDRWDRRVPWVAGEIGLTYLVQSRIVEWWLHGEDVREGVGLEENPQHWPVYLVNDMGIRMLPYALGLAGLSFPGKSLRVELEGVGEGTWHWGLAPRETPAEDHKPDAFVQGRAPAFALVAGRRAPAERFLDDGTLVIGGDEAVAGAVLEHIRAYVE